ncbi:hypothetical protein [Carboxylicivirga linearis]|uniref:Lipoprotein n=1 Tax=Carboxylicivirga linearis TaxID=1628157 RepID=A0ABS5JQE6_9BACT|nr:hypothetical protein [Carboxylicivirga linearis]MBS2097028.1 hypothetical protein [Carboxylicivirga linearis]
MKIIPKIKTILFIATILLSACSKEEDNDQFSTLGAPKDKQNIIQAGISLASETNGLAQTDFANLCLNLAGYMQVDVSNHQNLVHSIAEIGTKMVDKTFIQTQFEELLTLTTNSCNDIGVIWNEGYGIWEWDLKLNDFIQTSADGEDITFLFPSDSNHTDNNVTLRLYDFTSYNGNFSGKGDVLEDGTILNEILKSLYLDIKVEDKLIASSNIIMDFSDSGNIENINLTFNPIPYSFQIEMSAFNGNASWRYTLLNDINLVFEQYIAGIYEGDFENKPVINDIYSSTQIGDIKIIAEVNSADLLNDISVIETKKLASKELANQTANVVNDNSILSIRYANNTIIANGNAVARLLEEETGEWIVDIAFQFSDESTEYITDLIKYTYLFEDNLDLILKKTENRLQ